MADTPRHIGDLRPDPRNARKHNPRNIGMIVDALHEVGPARSIVIDEDNNILAGNGTWEAAAQAGIERVQVIERDPTALTAVRVTGLSKRAKKRLALYDNRTAELAEWEPQVLADDKDALSGLFSAQELDDLLAGIAQDEPQDDPGAQIDRASELQEKWQTERGQLWQIGRHRLLCGDATSAEDVARLMAGARAQMVFTDPPYGVAYSGRGQSTGLQSIENDDLDLPALKQFLLDAFGLWDTFMVSGCVLYVCHADRPRGTRPVFETAFTDVGWKFSATIIWVKQAASMGWQDYRAQHEPLLYGWKQGEHYYCGDRSLTTVWEIDRDAQGKYFHPTQKPVELVERAIESSSKRDWIVFDGFVGGGTAIAACERTQRVCRAMDIEPKYVAVALERLSGMGLTPELIDG